MFHKIKAVSPLPDFCLSIQFAEGVTKIYEVEHLFNKWASFKTLQESPELFSEVEVDVGGYGIIWNDDLDLEVETIYEEGESVDADPIPINLIVANALLSARAKANMSQAELAKATGIDQADISKIERGIANPSVATLKRLAVGLGANLTVSFDLKDVS